MSNLLTKPEAAKSLKVSLRTIDSLLASKAIDCIKIGRSVRIHPDAVTAFVSKQTVKAAA